MEQPPLKIILEAAIMASDTPITLERLGLMFADLGESAPGREALLVAIEELAADYADRGIELEEVAGGWRFHTRASCAPWINRLWEERKPRYSRALLETLAIMAYRQPITRAEIEDIRGVAVSSGIIKTLHERDWIKIVGHRDVPGRPAVYATTREFLAYFNLSSLADLPTLAELRDIDELNPDLFADFEAQAAEAEAVASAEHVEEGGDPVARLVEALQDVAGARGPPAAEAAPGPVGEDVAERAAEEDGAQGTDADRREPDADERGAVN